MGRAVFTSQTPSLTDESDGAPGLTLGMVAASAEDAAVNGVWWFFPTGSPVGQVVGLLYDEDTQTELARANFGAYSLGAWNLATFASPVNVSAGNNVIAAIWTPDRYVATANLHGSAITNGDWTAPADDPGLRNGRFIVNASPAYPTQSFNANGYFVDLDITSSTTYQLAAAVAVDVDLAGTARAVLPLNAALAAAATVTATATRVQALQAALEARALLAPVAQVVVSLSVALGVDVDLVARLGSRDLDILMGRVALKWGVTVPDIKWRMGGPEL